MKTLRLRETNLERCPLGLGEMDKLEELDLADNRIQILDRQMMNLFKLKTLELQGNRIQVGSSYREELRMCKVCLAFCRIPHERRIGRGIEDHWNIDLVYSDPSHLLRQNQSP